jgi:excisionase family DNA binding protein
MINPETRIIDLTSSQLQELISDAVKKELANFQSSPQAEADELLTLEVAASMLKVSKVTLHKWKRDGKIKFHRIGSRIRFKKSELLNAGVIKKKRRDKP